MHDSHILVFIHIVCGSTGILTGFLALFLRKGSRPHRRVGNVFVGAMLTMAAAATYMAYVGTEVSPPNVLNVLMGLLTFYLVTTAWLTGRRKDGERSWVDGAWMLVALGVGLTQWRYGFLAAGSPTGEFQHSDASPYFFFGSIALLAAVLDLRQLVWGVHGAHRIARHLWRMSFGLWIATTSLFLGQPQVFPHWMHAADLVFIPPLAVGMLLLYWLIRVLFGKRYKRKTAAKPATAASAPVMN